MKGSSISPKDLVTCRSCSNKQIQTGGSMHQNICDEAAMSLPCLHSSTLENRPSLEMFGASIKNPYVVDRILIYILILFDMFDTYWYILIAPYWYCILSSSLSDPQVANGPRGWCQKDNPWSYRFSGHNNGSYNFFRLRFYTLQASTLIISKDHESYQRAEFQE